MNGAGKAAANRDSAQREFELIEGEIEAGMVFAAAAAQFQTQDRNKALAKTCVSDATRCYANALVALHKADLAAAQTNDLKAGLTRLEQVLKSLRKSRTRRAA